jgi:hypothetical protein
MESSPVLLERTLAQANRSCNSSDIDGAGLIASVSSLVATVSGRFTRAPSIAKGVVPNCTSGHGNQIRVQRPDKFDTNDELGRPGLTQPYCALKPAEAKAP